MGLKLFKVITRKSNNDWYADTFVVAKDYLGATETVEKTFRKYGYSNFYVSQLELVADSNSLRLPVELMFQDNVIEKESVLEEKHKELYGTLQERYNCLSSKYNKLKDDFDIQLYEYCGYRDNVEKENNKKIILYNSRLEELEEKNKQKQFHEEINDLELNIARLTEENKKLKEEIKSIRDNN